VLDGRRSGVLVKGVCQASVFVATEVLISADAFDDEQGIRGWLAEHNIHVTAPRRSSGSTRRGAAGPIGSGESAPLMTTEHTEAFIR
jgi:hypothetical protein